MLRKQAARPVENLDFGPFNVHFDDVGNWQLTVSDRVVQGTRSNGKCASVRQSPQGRMSSGISNVRTRFYRRPHLTTTTFTMIEPDMCFDPFNILRHRLKRKHLARFANQSCRQQRIETDIPADIKDDVARLNDFSEQPPFG